MEELRLALFEVAPADDDAFLAAWAGGGTLHRALRRDARFRFATIGPPDTPGGLRFPVHAGAYEIAREHGTVDVAGGVLLIDPFEVPSGADEAFLEGREQARAVLANSRGHLGTRLLRSVGEARFRFVDVARWSSPLMVARAVARPEFQAVARMPFPSYPALYVPAAPG